MADFGTSAAGLTSWEGAEGFPDPALYTVHTIYTVQLLYTGTSATARASDRTAPTCRQDSILQSAPVCTFDFVGWLMCLVCE